MNDNILYLDVDSVLDSKRKSEIRVPNKTRKAGPKDTTFTDLLKKSESICEEIKNDLIEASKDDKRPESKKNPIG